MEPATLTVSAPVTSSRQTTTDATAFLDGCRGLAALYVVIGHARYLLAAGYQDGLLKHAADYSTFGKASFYALSIFRFGHDAVLFFFVLSGFVIHLRQAKGLATRPEFAFGWRQYLWRRARRLYPPLLLAIGVTTLLDYVGMHQQWPIYFGRAESAAVNASVTPVHDSVTLLGNLAFLMSSYVPTWGTDSPLWSLHFEWWFYMFYPLFYLATKRSWKLATLFMAGLFALSHVGLPAWAMLFKTVFSAMIVWWMGALLAEVYAGRIRVPMKYLAMLTICLPLGLVMETRGGQYLPEWLLTEATMLTLGVGVTGVMSAGLYLQSRGISLVILNRLKWLGEMSYTLYVIHFPILVFLGGWLMAQTGENLLPRHSGWVLPGVALAMAVAFGAHFVVERPFLPQQRRQ